MKLIFCAACGSSEGLEHHHLVARGESDSDDERNLITLCHGCAAKLYARRLNGGYSVKGVPNRDEVQARDEALRPVFAELAGKSARAIAAELNERNVETPLGRRWHALTVVRVQRRLKESAS